MQIHKVVITDDHPVYRKGLRFLLNEFDMIKVVYEAKDGDALLNYLETNSADLIFMDIRMPNLGGFDTSKKIISSYPDIKIIVLTMFGKQEYYEQMIELGVHGFLTKNADKSEILKATEMVLNGDTYFARGLIDDLKTKRPKLEYVRNENMDKLTARELDVLRLICKGLSTCEIAKKLFISQRTVDGHRANLTSKTGSKNSASLVMYAVRNRIIDIDPIDQ